MGLISRVSSRTYRNLFFTLKKDPYFYFKMVKTIKSELECSIESFGDEAKLVVRGQKVIVTGPRSTLQKDLSHLKVELKKTGPQSLKITKWWCTNRGTAALNTVSSHITNMVISDNGKTVDIKNFLGERKLRRVSMLEGVTISASPKQKDEYWLEGNDVEKVSQTCALIYQKAIPRNKDIRKFLDGVYVNAKCQIKADNELLGL